MSLMQATLINQLKSFFLYVILLLVFSVDIIYTRQLYLLSVLLVKIADAMGTRRNIYFHVGLFYIAIKIRESYIFTYPHKQFRMLILFRDNTFRKTKILPWRFFGFFVRGRKEKAYQEKSLTLYIIHGSAKIFDPAEKAWFEYEGSFPLIEFR